MARFYGLKIQRGERTMDDVPLLWRVQTEKWLAKHPTE